MINRNKQQSFTLIELLVVIVIIGILAGVIMISTSSSIDKANFTKAQTFSNAVQEELLLNLVSEWTFDEDNAAPTTIKDVWGNNDGAVSGDPQVLVGESCVSVKCLDFDGLGDLVNLGPALKYGIDENFTLGVWIYPREQKDYLTILDRGWSNPGSFDLYIGVNSIRLATKNTLSNRVDATYTTQIELNSWHYVVASYDSTASSQNVKLYFDGVLRAWPTQSGSLNYDTVLNLGNSFNGLMDNVGIYSAAFSSSQIKQNYIAGLDSLLLKGVISKDDYDNKIAKLAQK